jgi:hypothetical protein
MLNEFLASGTLNLVYAGVVLTSFIFAVVSLLGAEVGEMLDFDVDADMDGGLDFVSISPFALAIFGAAFGMTGLVTRLWLDLEAIPSVVWAAVVGILIGGVAQVFFIYVLSPSKSSHFSLADDAIGREVQVIVTIPGPRQRFRRSRLRQRWGAHQTWGPFRHRQTAKARRDRKDRTNCRPCSCGAADGR